MVPTESWRPFDDPLIKCEVRLWFDGRVVVFVHPRDWKLVVAGNPVPMVVTCGITQFKCEVASCGEFYRLGMPMDVRARDLPYDGPGDYGALVQIDWMRLVPEVLVQGLLKNPRALAKWRTLTSAEMRSHIAMIRRARLLSSQVERCLKVLRQLESNEA